MPGMETVHFEITPPTDEEIRDYGNQPIETLHRDFKNEADRLAPDGITLKRFWNDDGSVTASLRNNGDLAELIEGPYKVYKDTKELTVRQVCDVGEHGYYAGVLTLGASMLIERHPYPSTEGDSEEVPSLNVRYQVEVPGPRLLLGEFGLYHVIRATTLDGPHRGLKEVFHTGDITPSKDNTYEASLAKQAFGSAIAAMKKLPDYQVSTQD